jgi:hypothetical protein
MKQKLNSIAAFLGIAFAISSSTNAQSQSQDNEILTLARDSAIVAGGAKYCKFDDDLVEEYTAKAEARLSALAADEYEKVLARLEFKNILDAYSVRAPKLGCSEFQGIFNRALRSVD